MPIYGLNNGTVPMISYNYGAGRMDRVRQTVSLALKAALVLMIVLVLVFMQIPGQLLRMFSASDTMLSIGITALRITCLSLPFGAVTLILCSSFQALGYSRYTLIINLGRQLIFIVPIAWLMSLSGNLTLVWSATVIAEALSMILSIFFNRRVHKKLA